YAYVSYHILLLYTSLLVLHTVCIFFPYTTLFRSKNLSKLFLKEKEPSKETKKQIANDIVEIVNYLHDCDITIGDIIYDFYNIIRSEEHTSELQSRFDIVWLLILD